MLHLSLHDCLAIVRIIFFNDPATTEIYTLSLHDALPIWMRDVDADGPAPGSRIHHSAGVWPLFVNDETTVEAVEPQRRMRLRSEEHTSELQSRQYIVCRLLLEKKKRS